MVDGICIVGGVKLILLCVGKGEGGEEEKQKQKKRSEQR